MGKRWRKAPFVLLGLLVLFAAGQAFAAAVIFNPADQTKTLGQQAIVDIVFKGADVRNHLGAFDFVINYDPAIVSLAGVTFGNGLNLADETLSFRDSALATGNMWEVSLVTKPQELIDYQAKLELFTLARLTFNTLDLGISKLWITDSIFADADGKSYKPELFSGSITVVKGGNTVPEPATMLLLGSGLAGLGIWRKKR